MTRVEISDKFADMCRRSREDAGKSQAHMAKAMGVSKKTIQNWESGISSQSIRQSFEWFDALGVPPLPYYLDLLYPDIMQKLSADPTEDAITETIITAVSHLGIEQKKKLLYLFLGKHGSSISSVLELITAHLQTPLRDRVSIAQGIALNYNLAKKTGSVIRPDDIQPDLDFLNHSIQCCMESVIDGKIGYSTMIKNEDQ